MQTVTCNSHIIWYLANYIQCVHIGIGTVEGGGEEGHPLSPPSIYCHTNSSIVTPSIVTPMLWPTVQKLVLPQSAIHLLVVSEYQNCNEISS